MKGRALIPLAALLLLLAATGPLSVQDAPTLMAWPEGEVERYLHDIQLRNLERAEVATGSNGAVVVALNGFAARAGLEALKKGGSAADAALTAALTQVALTAGGPVSYFGILSFVYYDAESRQVVCLNADWNTVRGETDARSIPGRVSMSSEEAALGTEPSGRTALVGGFMKGVEAAHARFGRLPYAALFEPAIHIAENGFLVRPGFVKALETRAADLARLPETRAVFTKPDGSSYREGDVFRQPALARTLRILAAEGADYMYSGPWGKKLVAAVRADGGKMTLQDLEDYEVLWQAPLKAPVGAYEIHISPPPNLGGVSLIEALNLAMVAGLPKRGHWSSSGEVLRDAVNISMAGYLRFRPQAALADAFPGMDFSPASRVTPAHASELWRRVRNGAALTRWEQAPREPRHSDNVVAIDLRGNIAAITHTINSVEWGKTAILIDGVSIGDPASYQQARIAQVVPGSRLPSQTETGILFHVGVPVLGFGSMGAGLHQRTFQALMNVIGYGMTIDEAIDAPDFLLPRFSPTGTRVLVPQGRFPPGVLREMGYAFDEIDLSVPQFGGAGTWIAIHRDPKTRTLRAASNNRKNGAAVAY